MLEGAEYPPVVMIFSHLIPNLFTPGIFTPNRCVPYVILVCLLSLVVISISITLSELYFA